MQFKQVEQAWRKETQKKVNEFKSEMGDYGKCLRLSALYEQLFEVEDEIIERYTEYEQERKNDSAYINRVFIALPIPALEKKLKRLEMQIWCVVNKSKTITDGMIAHAREYPIENIISVKHNMALCVNHAENQPSMNCKNNFAYCHACGWRGDTIDVKMKIDNINFVEAVKLLQ